MGTEVLSGADQVSAPIRSRGRPRAERRETRALLALTFPALLLILVIDVAPMVWMIGMSFVGPEGPTLVNYARLLHPSYLLTFKTTFELAFAVSFLCVLLGYPLAYLISQLPRRLASIGLLCVLIPFTTSLLVRIYGWLVLLNRRGVINSWLASLHVTSEPLPLVYNFLGTLIGMVHIMLPYMVLPLYAAFKALDPDLVRAAASMGASPAERFWHVVVPLTLPGLASGFIAVFVLTLGFYVTPALLGGGRVMMWSMQIERSVALYPDWGAASALAAVLLVVTLGVLGCMARLVRLEAVLRHQ